MRGRIRWVLSLALIFLILLSAGYIVYKTVVAGAINNGQIARQKELYENTETNTTVRAPEGMEDKFAALYSQNPDIRGWITMLNTTIDHPVYQAPSSDSEFYLHHNAEKQESKHGSVYLASSIDLQKNPRTLVLYGHNMNDGTMFHDLLKYKDLSFYKENPVFVFDTIYEAASWKVFAVFSTNTRPDQGEVFDYQRTSFVDDNDFMAFVGQLTARSKLDTGVDVTASDQLLILSTCSYEHKDFRTVVVVRKIRQDESPVTDTDDATIAANPIVPDVCKGCSHA